MVTTRDAPDTDLAGYPANLKAVYRISGLISGLTNSLIIKYNPPAIFKARFMNIFFSKLRKGEIFFAKIPTAKF
jgi:hypothetical protein